MSARTGPLSRGATYLVVFVFAVAACVFPASGRDRAEPAALVAVSVVALAELPAEARQTVGVIRRGGPFPYDRDGVVFGNLERALPVRARGYYREYTVSTPGLTHRGVRRVIAGRGGELYYTDDHYRTFKRIRE